MRLNLDDIARIAGVSRATASRVINEHPDVSASTREKVRRVIEENNYQPNLAARMLATQRTQIISIVINNLPQAFNSQYSTILMSGIHSVAQTRDYATVLWWEETSADRERLARRILHQNGLMDGVILATPSVDVMLIEQMVDLHIPFVMTERPTRCNDEINYITIDDINGAQTITTHLITGGRRRIAHITGSLDYIAAQDRLMGYQNALQQHDIPYDPSLVIEGTFTQRSGYLAMKELLARDIPIDAVFAGNDESALGAIRALAEAGICIPDDMALVGFDDLPFTEEPDPQLTTIRQPVKERGALATTLLLDIVEERVDGPQHIVLPTELVIRDTCGAKHTLSNP